MTEDMKRLIKDGKIIGYQHHFFESLSNNRMVIMEAERFPFSEQDIVTCISNGECSVFNYDSFDLGIKVGDEWWFENDKISNDGFITTLRYGEFADTSTHRLFSGWHITNGEFIMAISAKELFNNLKRIGTIYDK